MRSKVTELAAPWLRGRTRYAPEVQAAEAALAGARSRYDGALYSTQALDDGGYRVAFGSHAVAVRPGTAVDVLASCGDDDARPVDAVGSSAIET